MPHLTKDIYFTTGVSGGAQYVTTGGPKGTRLYLNDPDVSIHYHL